MGRRRSTKERLNRLAGSPPATSSHRSNTDASHEEPTSRPRDPVRAGLAHVERELLGAEALDETLSVKQRLERLVAATGRSPSARSTSPGRTQPGRRSPLDSLGDRLSGVDEWSLERNDWYQDQTPLEELVPAEEVEVDGGRFLRMDWRYGLDHHHGRVRLERILQLPQEGLGLLAQEPLGLDMSKTIFLDTETTGLAGGSGTCAFLVGVGFVEEDQFVVRQFLMRDFDEERAMLADLTSLLPRFDNLLTYNGKSFDVPLLETRLIMTRQRFSFENLKHLDLLHPARNLWKRRFESCRLMELENALLGLSRDDDVPGHLIPRLYFDFIRSRRARPMVSVLAHNRYDILSLAALTARAAEMLEEDHVPEDPLDDLSLGMLFERAQLLERSARHYRRAIAARLEGRPRFEAQTRLAGLHKKGGNWHEAEQLWSDLQKQDTELAIPALAELAMVDEHRRQDFERALTQCDLALQQLGDRYHWPLRFREKWTEAFHHRRRRLRRRQRGIPLSRKEQESLMEIDQ